MIKSLTAVFTWAVTAGAVSPSPLPPDTALPARYDLRAGDHLVYRQRIERTVDGRVFFGVDDERANPYTRPAVTTFEVELDAHLLVVGAVGEGAGRQIAVGIQRNRHPPRLLAHEVDGEDRVEEEGETLRRSRPDAGPFADADRVTTAGVSLVGPTVPREWPSKALWDVREIVPLPDTLRQDETWTVNPALARTWEVADEEEVDGESCLRLEGRGEGRPFVPWGMPEGDYFTARAWFCPESGVVRRVRYTAEYPGAGFQKMSETVELELVERRRDESVKAWLADPELRLGTLRGLALLDPGSADSLDVPPLLGVEGGDPTRELRAALDVFVGWETEVDDGLRTALGEHFDPVVRAAAAAWGGAPPEWSPPGADGRRRDVALGVALARQAARLADPDAPETVCRIGGGWRSAYANHRRRPWQPPGTRIATMTTEGFEGWPYVVHLPPGYRGDRPRPVIVYLAGNSGSSVEGVRIAHAALEDRTWISVYPNAFESWWHPGSEDMMGALLEELLRRYAIDPSRIYLTGLSNGGTGAYLYATLWPHRLTAVVSAMGGGRFTPGPRLPRGGNTRHLPLLFLHGAQDRTIQPGASMETHKRLTDGVERTAPAELHLFRDRGHGILLERGDEGRTLDFLERFRGRAVPRELLFRTADDAHTRHYWVEITALDTTGVGAEAEAVDTPDPRLRSDDEPHAVVEARIAEDGVVHLRTEHVGRLRLHLTSELVAGADTLEIRWNGSRVHRGPVRHSCEALAASLGRSADPWLASTFVWEGEAPE